jgi:hypothetical protein
LVLDPWLPIEEPSTLLAKTNRDQWQLEEPTEFEIVYGSGSDNDDLLTLSHLQGMCNFNMEIHSKFVTDETYFETVGNYFQIFYEDNGQTYQKSLPPKIALGRSLENYVTLYNGKSSCVS